MATDSFDIPDDILGQHSEEFYGAVGRIVTLSAVLENGLLALVAKLDRPDSQLSLAKMSAARLIAEGRSHLAKFDDAAQRARAEGFLNDVEGTMRERNDMAHNLWPAQPGGELFGWRPSRNKAIGSDETRIKPTDMAALSSLIQTLVRLIQTCPAIAGSHLRVT